MAKNKSQKYHSCGVCSEYEKHVKSCLKLAKNKSCGKSKHINEHVELKKANSDSGEQSAEIKDENLNDDDMAC